MRLSVISEKKILYSHKIHKQNHVKYDGVVKGYNFKVKASTTVKIVFNVNIEKHFKMWILVTEFKHPVGKWL